jgi:sugar-specific transcriptional regulator TrmB
MTLLHELKRIGLSDNESRVYLAMLELGPATMLQIGAKAEVNRPTAYAQIESLKKKGLVNVEARGKKHLFRAESPEQLERLLGQEQKAFDEKHGELAKMLPELLTLHNLAEHKPIVRYFDGKEGLLRMHEEFLKTKEKKIYAISAIDEVYRVFPDHQQLYRSRRIQKKIRSKLIYTSVKGDYLQREDVAALRETRFVAQEQFPFSVDLTIFDDSVAIASLRGKLLGLIIKNRDIADSFRGMFHFFGRCCSKSFLSQIPCTCMVFGTKRKYQKYTD